MSEAALDHFGEKLAIGDTVLYIYRHSTRATAAMGVIEEIHSPKDGVAWSAYSARIRFTKCVHGSRVGELSSPVHAYNLVKINSAKEA